MSSFFRLKSSPACNIGTGPPRCSFFGTRQACHRRGPSSDSSDAEARAASTGALPRERKQERIELESAGVGSGWVFPMVPSDRARHAWDVVVCVLIVDYVAAPCSDGERLAMAREVTARKWGCPGQ